MLKFVALLALAISPPAFAQASKGKNAAPPVWSQEPTAVFGLPLGEKLAPDGLKVCGGVMVEGPQHPISMCQIAGGNRWGNIEVAGLPVDIFEGGLVVREDEVVTKLSINLKHENYSAAKAILLERYGKPTLVQTGRAKNLAGADFPTESLIWSGKKVMLLLEERTDSMKASKIIFSLQSTAEKNVRDAENKRKSDASKM